MSDIPLSYISSTTLSTACTVLIFSVAGVGLLSLAGMYYKKSKRNAFMSTTVISGKIALLDDDALNKILSFGEETEWIDSDAYDASVQDSVQNNGCDAAQ